jgi:site-specific DNA recombinase
LVPDEEKAIAEATTALLAGASLRGIAAQWNAEGRPTSTGGVWHPNALRVTLTRPRNAGLMEHQGKVIGKANWPAIVSEAEWQALVDKLADPKRRTNGRGPGRKWLGSGIYRCECGGKLICSTSNKGPAYRCRDGCGRLSRRQADVDALVGRVIVERLRQPDLVSLVARDRGDEVQALESQAVGLRSRLDSLAGFYAQGVIDAQQLTEGTKAINVALAEVRDKISKIYDGSALAGIVDADDAGSAWLEAPLDRKRAVLDAVATVTLLRGGHGRPAGWQPGQTYFRPELVKIEWKTS